MSSESKVVLKVILLGSCAVGRTSLIQRFVDDTFTFNTLTTIGVEFHSKEIVVDGKLVKLLIFDTASQERVEHLLRGIHGVDCCILVCDVSQSRTFQSLNHHRDLDYWHDGFLKYASPPQPQHFPFVVIGNKVDLDNREVSSTQLMEWCSSNGALTCFEASAKEAVQVQEAFYEAARKALACKSSTKQPAASPQTKPDKSGCLLF